MIQNVKPMEYQLIRKTESKNQVKCVYGVQKNKAQTRKTKQTNKKLLRNKNLMWSTSPGRHQRRICHLKDIFYLLLNLPKSPDNVPLFTQPDFLWCVAAMTDRYRIQEFRISPLPPSHRKYVCQSYCLTKHSKHYQPHCLVQNYIRADACHVTIVSLPNYKAFSWESGKKAEIPPVLRKPLPVTKQADTYWTQGKNRTYKECQLAQYFKCYFS